MESLLPPGEAGLREGSRSIPWPRMQTQELFYARCAPLAAGRKAPSGTAWGKGAAGPWDRHEGHRGAACLPTVQARSDWTLAPRTRRQGNPIVQVLVMFGDPAGTKMQVGPIFKNETYPVEALHNKRFPPRVCKRLGEPDSKAFIEYRI